MKTQHRDTGVNLCSVYAVVQNLHDERKDTN